MKIYVIRITRLSLILISMIIGSGTSIGQTNDRVDSLLSLLPANNDSLNYLINSTIVVDLFYKDIERTKGFIEEEIKIAKRSDMAIGLADGYVHKATYFGNVGLADSAFHYFDKAATIIEANDWRNKKINLYNNYGVICSNLGYWDRGLENLQKSQNIIDSSKPDTFMTIRNYSSMGAIQGEMGNFEKSNEYFNKTHQLAKESKNEEEMAWSRMMQATNFIDLGDINKAKIYFKELISYYDKDGMGFELARAYSNYGHTLQLQDSLTKAKQVYLKGKELGDQLGFADVKVEFLQRLAAINMDLKAYKAAIPHLKEAIPLSVEMGSIINQARNNKFLATCYQETGKSSLAYEHLNNYITLNDSIKSDEKVSLINELETKYQTEKKEQEIKLLEEKAKRNSLEKKGMIGGIISLLGLFGSVVYAMRQRMIKNQLAKDKVDQELEFSHKELEMRKQELTAYALQLAHKNEVLEGIKSDVNEIKKTTDQGKDLQRIVNTISINQSDDESWEGFRKRFVAVHKNFEKDVKEKYPNVSTNELRIMALLKMQLTSKEIANILNISGEGIKKARYRLRKKLGMASGDSLEMLVLSI